MAASGKKAKGSAAEYAEARVSCDGYTCLNVRKGAGMKHEVIRTLANGEKVMAAKAVRGWRKLDGGGYVKAEFLA